MKKISAVLSAAILIAAFFASCAKSDETVQPDVTEESETSYVQMTPESDIYITDAARTAYKKIIDDIAGKLGYINRTDSSSLGESDTNKGVILFDFFDWDGDKNAEMFIAYSKSPLPANQCDTFDVYTFDGINPVKLLSENPGAEFGSSNKRENVGIREKSGNISLVFYDSSDPETDLYEKIYTYNGSDISYVTVKATAEKESGVLGSFFVNEKAASESEYKAAVACDNNYELYIFPRSENKNEEVISFLDSKESTYDCYSIFHKTYIFENDTEIWIYSDPHFGTLVAK